MLEMGGLLATWALPEPPGQAGVMRVESLPDHRLAYLDYEGPVSGGRGSVARWAGGTYRVLHESDTELCVRLEGRELAGRATLRRLSGESPGWEFRLVAD
jgi:hypothetical protein